MIDSVFDLDIDNLNRTAKLFLDRGETQSFEESTDALRAFSLHAEFDDDIDTGLQIALLTFINTASRFALGGVTVRGNLNAQLKAPFAGCKTIGDAVLKLGGHAVESNPLAPSIIFGSSSGGSSDLQVRIICNGWAGGIIPHHYPLLGGAAPAIAPAAVLAGALAASEGFTLLRKETPLAFRRPVGLSLWKPEQIDDWYVGDAVGPKVSILPNDFWILGLGHIGQAFLWTAMMSPYNDPSTVRCVLNDFDEITGANLSTSMLTSSGMVGEKKTRAIAHILEERGFTAWIVERRFDAGMQRAVDDPQTLICCVDNAAARCSLESAGFPLVIESGIGGSADDFRSIRLHTFPGPRKAANIWCRDINSVGKSNHAYEQLADRGLDQCGLARLSNTAVGAPFVGAVAGPLMYSQLLRILHKRTPLAALDIGLIDARCRRIISNAGFRFFNPGYSQAAT